METGIIQIIGVTIGTFISIITMLIKIRKEIVRQQKGNFRARLQDERRLLALEKRIELLEQQTLASISSLEQRLFELNQRFDLFYEILYKHYAKSYYENE